MKEVTEFKSLDGRFLFVDKADEEAQHLLWRHALFLESHTAIASTIDGLVSYARLINITTCLITSIVAWIRSIRAVQDNIIGFEALSHEWWRLNEVKPLTEDELIPYVELGEVLQIYIAIAKLYDRMARMEALLIDKNKS